MLYVRGNEEIAVTISAVHMAFPAPAAFLQARSRVDVYPLPLNPFSHTTALQPSTPQDLHPSSHLSDEQHGNELLRPLAEREPNNIGEVAQAAILRDDAEEDLERPQRQPADCAEHEWTADPAGVRDGDGRREEAGADQVAEDVEELGLASVVDVLLS